MGGNLAEAAGSERAGDQLAEARAGAESGGEGPHEGDEERRLPESGPSAQPPAPAAERQPAGQPGVAPPDPAPGEADARARLVRAARSHLGRYFAGDCSTFVRRVYAEAGVALPALEEPRRGAGARRGAAASTMTESLYRSLSPVPAPQPGDLAYFRRTRRSDRGGKGRDRLTHVAIIEAVDGPSVILIHRASRGIRRLAMNLARPHDPDENGIVRRRWGGDRRRVPSLAGELFAGYGTALSGKREPPPSFRVESSPSRSDRDVPRG